MSPSPRLVLLLVFLFYLALTAVATYPLIIELPTAVIDFGDPLLNSWILAWNAHALLTDPLRLFDANIFYPHRWTLAYSELLIVPSLLGLPITLIWGNPILTHNLLLFTSYALSAFAVYLLVVSLTGDRRAGLVSGVIFAFASFRIGRLGQLQIQLGYWIPFAFYFLHRFVHRRRWRDLLLFALMAVAQTLSNGHYGYYLALAVALFFGLTALLDPASRRLVLWRRVALGGLLALAVVLPFLLPYWWVRDEVGLIRHPGELRLFSARLESYLSAPRTNLFFGDLTAHLRRPEGELFTGFVVLGLALVGLWPSRSSGQRDARDDLRRRLVVGLECLALISALAILTVLRPLAPAVLLLASLGLRALLARGQPWFFQAPTLSVGRRAQIFYVALTLFGLLLSFGPTFHSFGIWGGRLPYATLYRFLPGFSSLRVPARFAVLVMLGLAVLAGFGLARLLRSQAPLRAWLIGFCLVGLVSLEYFSAPLPFREFPREIPPVYHWLASQPDGIVIAELPAAGDSGHLQRDAVRVYYSTVHWKRMINGYSGFFPPGYWEQSQLLRTFPSRESIARLREVGVRYIILRGYSPPDLAWVLRHLPQDEFVGPPRPMGDAVLLELPPGTGKDKH